MNTLMQYFELNLKCYLKFTKFAEGGGLLIYTGGGWYILVYYRVSITSWPKTGNLQKERERERKKREIEGGKRKKEQARDSVWVREKEKEEEKEKRESSVFII